MKILVLAGGLSTERDVSLSSGSKIANALRERGHAVRLADVFMGLELSGADPDSFFLSQGQCPPDFYRVPETPPDLDQVRASRKSGERGLIGPGILPLALAADVVFLALHGAEGEYGRIQAMLDLLGIRYTGSGFAGSAVTMDKDLAKKVLRHDGVLTADWITMESRNLRAGAVLEAIGLPCVVKPCSGGSSIGVSLVHSAEELERAMEDARRYDGKVLFEKLIPGREFSVGVLDGKALPPIEIIPKTGFYDFKNKYQAGLTDEICPARLSGEETAAVEDAALSAHCSLGLGTYSRVDFILSGDGLFYCLEANTLPGMTPTSLLPQEAAVLGINYGELCDRLVQLAVRER